MNNFQRWGGISQPPMRPPPPPYPKGSDLSKQLNEALSQIKELQEEKTKMQQDNQELRDLCCFLDDDRQRARKLAKEWQKFGRYTSKVMRQEVTIFIKVRHVQQEIRCESQNHFCPGQNA